jgi:hypothetical protein
MPLLRHFVQLQLELDALWARLERARPGTARSLELTVEVSRKGDELCALAETLHLLPGQKAEPPRLQ